MNYLLIILLLLGLCNLAWTWKRFSGGKHKDNLGEPALSKDQVLPGDEWFQQNLDHFDPTNMQTWQQVST